MDQVHIVFFVGDDPKEAITLNVPQGRADEVLAVLHESTLNGLRAIGATDRPE